MSEYNYYQLFLLMGSFQGILLTIFLLFGNHHRKANNWLILLTFSWSFTCYIYAMQSYEFFMETPHLFLIGTLFTFLYFPPLFLYAKFIVKPDKKLTFFDLIHFVPFLLYFLFHLDFYLLPAEVKRYYIANYQVFYEAYKYRIIISDFILILQGFGYSWITLSYIKKHDEAIRSYFSNIEDAALDWLKTLIWVIVVLWTLGAVGTVLELLGNSQWTYIFDIFYLLLAMSIYMVVFMALRQPEIITDFSRKAIKSLKEDEVFASEMGKKVHTQVKAPLNTVVEEGEEKVEETVEENVFDESTEEELKQNAQKLLDFMQEEKPYLDRKLNLQSLAEMLDMHRHYLSYIINNQLGVNFHVFVNKYRVDEAKEKLLDPEYKDYKLEYLAVEAGFNSKSSFNRIFKSTTGLTPGEFKKKMMDEER